MAIVSIASPPPSLLFRQPVSLSRTLLITPHALLRQMPRALKPTPRGGLIGGREVCETDLGAEAKLPTVKDEEVDVREGISEGEKECDRKEGDERVNWEDRILEDTVPLVGFVRMILHSNKYVPPLLGKFTNVMIIIISYIFVLVILSWMNIY